MNHIHKYRRINIARKGNDPYWVMKCFLQGCNSYTPMRSKLSAPMLVGVVSLCNRCGNPFELDRRSLRLAEPNCGDCVKSEVKAEVNKAVNFFEELEKGLLK